MRAVKGVEQKQWEQVRDLLQKKQDLELVLKSGDEMSEKERKQREIELNQLEKQLSSSEDLLRRVL